MLGIAADRLIGGRMPGGACPFALASLLLLFLLIFLAYFRLRKTQFVFSIVLFALLGTWAAYTAGPQISSGRRLFPDRQPLSYISEVSAPPEYHPDKIRISLRLLYALSAEEMVPLDTGALLTIPRGNPSSPPIFYLPGDRLIVRAVFKPFRSFRNPGGFDYVQYQADRGFHAQGFMRDERLVVKLAPEHKFSPYSAINDVRRRIELFRQQALTWLKRILNPDSAGFYAALVLGYQNQLDARRQELISRTGLNHVLSVSGLHLGLVSLIVFWIVRLAVRLCCPSILNLISDKQIAVWPALVCAVLYAFLAGFAVPPIWRSVLMLAVCFGASFRYRRADSLSVLALAALVILAVDPGSLRQISFQFTFACVLAIILVYPRLQGLRVSGTYPFPGRDTIGGKIISQFEDAFWVSIAVSALVLPLTVYYFNGFSLAGFAANILLVPYIGFIILPAGLLSVVFLTLSETLSYPFTIACGFLLSPALWLIEWFGNFSWSYFWTGSIPLAWLLVIYAALFFLILPTSWKTRTGGIAALAIAVLCAWTMNALTGAKEGALLRVDVIDVGQGTSTLVRFPTGKTMLVDGGGFADNSFDIGRRVLAPFLWHAGVRGLDHVVLSHAHPDHANGLRFILSHFDTGLFWTSGIGPNGSEGIHSILQEIALRRGISMRTLPELPDDLELGEARVYLRHPARDVHLNAHGRELNDLSLVLEITYGATSIILPGDIGGNVESEIAATFLRGNQTILVASHHGSESSNSEKLLDVLRPCAVIFPCGYENLYGFPAPGVIRRCTERNIPIYRTDLHGAIHAVSDGRQWTLTTEASD